MRQHGAAVAFGLYNFGYLNPGCFANTDAIIACSQFLADFYRRETGIHAVAIPQPISTDEVLPPDDVREPTFFTFVNPSLEKGLMFVATLAEELGKKRPDIPLLIVEGRSAASDLISCGQLAGWDLRRHSNIMTMPPTSNLRDIFAVSRAILVPSVWEEPAGRMAAEALVNGIPALVSGRGGLREVVGEGGFVLPLPVELTRQTLHPVAADAVQLWLHEMERLTDDEEYFEAACRRATRAGAAYTCEALKSQYAQFFHELLNRQPQIGNRQSTLIQRHRLHHSQRRLQGGGTGAEERGQTSF